MEYDLGTHVHSSEGKRIGTVDRIVLAEEGGPVRALVVHKGLLLSRDVLVPIEQVARMDDQGLHLSVGEDALDALPDFVADRFALPPDAAQLTPTYVMGGVMFPYDSEPGVAPMVTEEHKAIAEGLGDISRDATVLCADGEAGVVRDVVVDEARQVISYLLVDTGEDRERRVRVPAALIAEVSNDMVTLRCSLAEFHALAGQ